MKVVITGAAGFLGDRLADYLLADNSPIPVTELLLADAFPAKKRSDKRVKTIVLDITAPDASDKLIDNKCDVFFHLAAVVSGRSELDFDLGFRVNFDASRALLEKARQTIPTLKFVFVSTLAAYGGDLPPLVSEFVASTPQNSYGTAKSMVELLVNDYSRRGFVDGRIVRLPTVTVRAGKANEALTSFASGIIREPLNGEKTVCPTRLDLVLWVTSPATVIKNIAYAATLPTGALGQWRCVNIPGFGVSVQEMLDALETVGGKKALSLVRYERDPRVELLVESLPTNFDNSRALSLGFTVDKNFLDVVRAYVRDELKRKD
ncbi:hypothetical protein K1T71_012451 [Dendrolimus kikuchii]|uniref:Uncharacterized protein n=1 Tax=Dendrolimus kikuchii TaxID=765133 RepID=A0ACC1CJH1_9NEOP|nr:hypothetical protein K1T71_012451 [Dendrolimus kikuchii]